MSKSMRNAFIRVSEVNTIQDGNTIVYSYKELLSNLQLWADKKSLTYWIVKHDDDLENIHYHIVIKFKSPTPFGDIKSKFPYGKIENAKSIKSCVQYLIHMNDKDKFQYKWEDVETNCLDMDTYKMKTETKEKMDIQMYLDMIKNGEIREYNQYEKIPIEIWSKYKSIIKNGFEWYGELIAMNAERPINVIFITGASGIGKSVLARDICKRGGWSYCLSSSNNDALQDYKGQDVLILDDGRDNTFSFTDLLKLLDPNVRSSISSRYKNKNFIGHTVIITSYDDLDTWYNGCDSTVSPSARVQLYRRIKDKYVIVSRSKVRLYKLNENSYEHEYSCTIVNPVVEYDRVVKFENKTVAESLGYEVIVDDDDMNEVTCDVTQLAW